VSGEELRALAQRIAGEPGRWAPHVAHHASQRTFHRLVDDEDVTVWLVCWMPGQDTGFHDHDGSAAAIAVVEGEVLEERLRLLGEPARAVHRAGEVVEVGPDDIHRVRHTGTAPAVTVHAYSPPLRRMGAYRAEPDGTLRRTALDEDVELTAA
jgi:predicted metal-dependent enzyme (double-stranded beta helix superfamily)